jgi:hypothetical protein
VHPPLFTYYGCCTRAHKSVYFLRAQLKLLANLQATLFSLNCVIIKVSLPPHVCPLLSGKLLEITLLTETTEPRLLIERGALANQGTLLSRLSGSCMMWRHNYVTVVNKASAKRCSEDTQFSLFHLLRFSVPKAATQKSPSANRRWEGILDQRV